MTKISFFFSPSYFNPLSMSVLEAYAIESSLFTFLCIVFPMAISEVFIVRMNGPDKSRYCNTGFSHKNIFVKNIFNILSDFSWTDSVSNRVSFFNKFCDFINLGNKIIQK